MIDRHSASLVTSTPTVAGSLSIVFVRSTLLAAVLFGPATDLAIVGAAESRPNIMRVMADDI